MVIYVVKLVMDEIKWPEKIKTIAWLILGLLFFLALLKIMDVDVPWMR